MCKERDGCCDEFIGPLSLGRAVGTRQNETATFLKVYVSGKATRTTISISREPIFLDWALKIPHRIPVIPT